MASKSKRIKKRTRTGQTTSHQAQDSNFRPTVKPLTFDEQTPWTVFKDSVQNCALDKRMDGLCEGQSTCSLSPRVYRTELKTRLQKPGVSLQVLVADVERLMSLAYAEYPLDVWESLAAQFFVDAIRDEETQLSKRLMDRPWHIA
ncbi:hypothetical protein AVEN_95352-1 [Araneus ventricosus]|uniref:Uncharacterized protein n=1 Tax=Araneus ventricosus TaxID=182803 RepID=A0A4Y2EFT5_ARAVE|nr:hypothetical protein AVEN_95352-1 [Araneus ventricosus]